MVFDQIRDPEIPITLRPLKLDSVDSWIIQMIQSFTYETAHSPTLLYFTYITVHSTTLLLLHLYHRQFTYVTWWAAHGYNVYSFTDEAPPPTPLMESVEDTYITLTSAPPSMVMCQETNKILGLSVEGAVMHVLKSLEVKYYDIYSIITGLLNSY